MIFALLISNDSDKQKYLQLLQEYPLTQIHTKRDLATCVGPQCCGKEMQYDSKENKCIEGMKSLGSDYLCRDKKDDTIDLYNDNIMIIVRSRKST